MLKIVVDAFLGNRLRETHHNMCIKIATINYQDLAVNHPNALRIDKLGAQRKARFLGEKNSSWEHVGKLLAMASMTLQGTPYIYQGDELGMTNANFASIDEFRDVESYNKNEMLAAYNNRVNKKVVGNKIVTHYLRSNAT